MVFASAMRQWERARLARAGPMPGTATSSSRTRAVCAHGGGSARIRVSSTELAARSRLSCARALRTWLAFASACSRCSGERTGAPGLRSSPATALSVVSSAWPTRRTHEVGQGCQPAGIG